MRLFYFIVLLILPPLLASGQENSIQQLSPDVFSQIEEKSDNNMRIQQDSAISNLVLKHIAKNKENPEIDGYRIRIYADIGTQAREESEELRAEFHEKFPDIPIYRDYDDNWWKVYVGDFRTKIEAIKHLKRIRNEFPSAFVVPDKINFPELNESKDEK
ncbi:MAG: SPOR domain-containing protein [Bacteroidales bacterium]|nr:SPOR domain-containing protein [Bacteroidales bacterium]MBS3774376.1 SPOR domain-containing protein [Bacteroidales bacterium]